MVKGGTHNCVNNKEIDSKLKTNLFLFYLHSNTILINVTYFCQGGNFIEIYRLASRDEKFFFRSPPNVIRLRLRKFGPLRPRGLWVTIDLQQLCNKNYNTQFHSSLHILSQRPRFICFQYKWINFRIFV